MKYMTAKVFFIVLVISLAGCQTMDSMTKGQEFSLQGCAIGGLGAGAAALLKYHNDPNKEEKIATITAIGCLAGAVVGYSIGKRTQAYSNAQQAATTEIARNNSNAEKLKKANNMIKKNIADYDRQLSSLEKQNFSAEDKKNQQQAIKKSVAKQHKKAKSAYDEVTEELKLSRQEYKKYSSSVSSEHKKDWTNEIAALEQERQILSGHIVSLNALDSSI